MRRILVIGILVALAVLGVASVASAQEGYPPSGDSGAVGGISTSKGGTSAGSSGSQLATTGSDTTFPWLAVGGSLVLIGTTLTVVGVRRHSAPRLS